ncbi:MAG: 3'(2'),5'-bisphosphate nucleotidase CysQ family protein, partial [Polyangiaceae bacterium]
MRREAEVALDAAREAAAMVMAVYARPFAVELKGPDDPVTRADKESNALLCERLSRAFPGVPVVAEESDPTSYAGFAAAPAAWFVDPLDGTREFVAKNGEFAVMIGLAEEGRAIVGVVAAPAWGRTLVGVVGEGAWEVTAGGALRAIHVTALADVAQARFVVSRSRAPERVTSFIASLG